MDTNLAFWLADNPIYLLLGGLVFLAVALAVVRVFMRPFFWRFTLCLIPLVVAAVAVGNATLKYMTVGGGFKLGVDLVGGTILVYEVDPDKEQKTNLRESLGASLAASLKRRIDPNDLKNVTVRPVGDKRVEIILPTGGAHQSELDEQAWTELLKKVREHWPNLQDDDQLDPGRGKPQELVANIVDKTKDNPDEVEAFVKSNYLVGGKERQDVSGEEVQRIKDLIAQVGNLEFRIVANEVDDKDAIAVARDYIANPKNQEELQQRALHGQPPPPPVPPPDKTVMVRGVAAFRLDGEKVKGPFTYSWMELGRQERETLGLNNDAKDGKRFKADASFDPVRQSHWLEAEKNRNKTMTLWDGSQGLLYSRDCKDIKLPVEKRNEKKIEYFLLVRNPEFDPGTGEPKSITGNYLTSASEDYDEHMKLCIRFRFNSTGGDLFHQVTSANTPSNGFHRHLAIILDGQIISAPSLRSAIGSDGQITGNFSKREVDELVTNLRAGALPATLKQMPVSENTMGATLGEDTIVKGTEAVGWAFVAVLLFMLVYYRFSGMVACIALFANLLLTIGFMVMVNATFTLPGLAGLVLMLGMAVDANVLIYERLREERDRGASIALAIRNGYDRAFPTIIDTHLSSIFTAIVLYAVGNDQLKGFGVSLTVGLIISLFTSLVMTRLMFDIWLAKGWLTKLGMFRLLSRTNIDFMAIRYYWFTATILLTVLGLSLFLIRGREGLNIDFIGGTAYGGQLEKPLRIDELRKRLEEDNQKQMLQVVRVEEVPGEEGKAFDIYYKNEDGTQTKRTIYLANQPEGAKPAEEEAAWKSLLEQVKQKWPKLDDSDLNVDRGKVKDLIARIHQKTNDPAEEIKAFITQKYQDPSKPIREQKVKERAEVLPDMSVEQIFPRTEPSEGNKSRFFTVRTSEKEPELVQATIGRLLGELMQKKALSYGDIQADNKKVLLSFTDPASNLPTFASKEQVSMLLKREFKKQEIPQGFELIPPPKTPSKEERYPQLELQMNDPADRSKLENALKATKEEFLERPQPDRLENFDSQLASETQDRAMYAILASWGATLLYLWFRFGNWTFGLAAVLCLMHDLFFTLGIIALCHYIHGTAIGNLLQIQDFKIDLPAVAALLTLVGYSVNDTIVVFDRIREVRGKNPELTPQMINDSVNQTLSRTLLTAFSVWEVVFVLYWWGGEGVHLFAFVMVVGVIVGTYSSIYIASPLLLIFGEGGKPSQYRERVTTPRPEGVIA